MELFGVFAPFRPAGRRLFVKIFWVVWLAMSVAGVVLLALEAERTGRMEKRMQTVNDAAVAFYAVSVAKDHEDEQSWESRGFLKDLKARTNIEGWLFDMQGQEVSGHAPTDLRILQRHTTAIPELRRKAESTNATVYARLNTNTLAAHTAVAPSGKRYTLVCVLPQSRFGPWNAIPSVQVLRLLSVLATAAIVSWILALQITRPIATLREATHRLSEGELSARAAAGTESLRDELGELARDFNLMAERLETSIEEQTRLIEAQKRLLGDVAHELRSPLARITVALELARDASDESHDQPNGTSASVASAHDRIEREVGRLGELIGRLLMLSRLESGVQRRDDVPIELQDLIETIVSDANYEARPAKQVRFTNSLPTSNFGEQNSLCFVRGTPDLLQSAVENVVRNAVRHTKQNTTVEVALSTERNNAPTAQRWLIETDDSYVSPLPPSLLRPSYEWAVVRIRDDGPGVPPNEIREVFHPFYRTGKSRTKRDGGVGLGLAITFRAIQFHQGQVRATNAPEGGFVVEIRLPLMPLEDVPQHNLEALI